MQKEALGCMYKENWLVVTEFGLAGLQNTSQNGTFVQAGDPVNGMPAFQFKWDEGIWLCFVPQQRNWVLQPQDKKGTSSGWAMTVVGEHVAPWDTDATWMEYTESGTWDSVRLQVLSKVLLPSFPSCTFNKLNCGIIELISTKLFLTNVYGHADATNVREIGCSSIMHGEDLALCQSRSDWVRV